MKKLKQLCELIYRFFIGDIIIFRKKFKEKILFEKKGIFEPKSETCTNSWKADLHTKFPFYWEKTKEDFSLNEANKKDNIVSPSLLKENKEEVHLGNYKDKAGDQKENAWKRIENPCKFFSHKESTTPKIQEAKEVINKNSNIQKESLLKEEIDGSAFYDIIVNFCVAYISEEELAKRIAAIISGLKAKDEYRVSVVAKEEENPLSSTITAVFHIEPQKLDIVAKRIKSLTSEIKKPVLKLLFEKEE